MANETMTKIASIQVGAGTTYGFDFSNIPQTFTDLLVLVSARSTGNEIYLAAALNDNGSSVYSHKYLNGSGSSVASFSMSSFSYFTHFGSIASSSYTSNTFANSSIYIPNYTSASHKSISIDSVTENNATTSYQAIIAPLFASTSPITKVYITGNSANLAQYSTATLYGILKGSGGATVS